MYQTHDRMIRGTAGTATDRRAPIWRALACTGAALALVCAPDVARAFECSSAPLASCRNTTRPRKSKLNIRNGVRPDKQKLVWKWFRGEATPLADYGDPVTTEDYAFCMYTNTGTLVYHALVPAAVACRSRPCWKRLRDRGFAFRDGLASNDGITKIRLYRGTAGRARIIVKGSGANLRLTDLPLGLPTLVQLQGSQGICWQSAFAAEGMRRNNDTRFGGRSSSTQ